MASPVKQKGIALSRELAWDWFKGGLLALVPGVPTVLTWISARANDMPLWLIVPIAAFVFWATVTGLKAVLEMTAKARVGGKLIPMGVQPILSANANGMIDGFGVGLQLLSTSDRPLQYEVDSVNLVVDGRVNPNPNYLNMGALVMPLASTTFSAAPVVLGNIPVGQWVEGTYEISLRYGKPGRLNHQHHVKNKVAFLLGASDKLKAFNSYDI